MSYTPTVWETGDTVTAEKLNKVETEVASLSTVEPLWVDITLTEVTENEETTTTATMNVDPSDIVSAITNDVPVFGKLVDGVHVGAGMANLLSANAIEDGGTTLNIVAFELKFVEATAMTIAVITFANSRTTTDIAPFAVSPAT